MATSGGKGTKIAPRIRPQDGALMGKPACRTIHDVNVTDKEFPSASASRGLARGAHGKSVILRSGSATHVVPEGCLVGKGANKNNEFSRCRGPTLLGGVKVTGEAVVERGCDGLARVN